MSVPWMRSPGKITGSVGEIPANFLHLVIGLMSTWPFGLHKQTGSRKAAVASRLLLCLTTYPTQIKAEPFCVPSPPKTKCWRTPFFFNIFASVTSPNIKNTDHLVSICMYCLDIVVQLLSLSLSMHLITQQQCSVKQSTVYFIQIHPNIHSRPCSTHSTNTDAMSCDYHFNIKCTQHSVPSPKKQILLRDPNHLNMRRVSTVADQNRSTSNTSSSRYSHELMEKT